MQTALCDTVGLMLRARLDSVSEIQAEKQDKEEQTDTL